MNEFEQLIFDMRRAQKEYFKTRHNDWMMRSKALEKKVDQHLYKINNPSMF
jgi:hypothetical protein